MERLPGGLPVPAALRGGVVALGNFDGFHVGHQAVVGRALARARAEGRPALVASFDPHPARLFRPDSPPFLLTTMNQRMNLFAEFGMDGAIAMPFDRAMASIGPENFVAEWLHDRFGAAAVVTGGDFTFGRDRAGNITALSSLAAAHGIATEVVSPIEADGAIASSTRVRACLKSGDMAGAARLLGRPWTIEGIVQHGDALGRTIGFPTANLAMGDYQRPAYGIYAVRGVLADGRVLDGAANLGIRPQFDPPKELLEPHFFDFSGDLYDQPLSVQLIEWLRPETRFDSLEGLIDQITADCAEARRILAARPRAL